MLKNIAPFFSQLPGPYIADYAVTTSLGTISFEADIASPANTRAGDMLVLLVNQIAAGGPPLVSDASFASGPNSGTPWYYAPGNVPHCTVFYLIAAGTEPTTLRVFCNTGTLTGTFIVLLIRGHDSSAPIAALNFSSTYTSNATFTASWSGTTLTATAVSGTMNVGDVIGMNGSPNNSTILSQLTGTPGGIGTYQMSTSTTLTSRAGNSNSPYYPAVVSTNPASGNLLLQVMNCGYVGNQARTGSSSLSVTPTSSDVTKLGLTTFAWTGTSGQEPSITVFYKRNIAAGPTLSNNFYMSKASCSIRLETIVIKAAP